MKLNRASQYAVRALVALASHDGAGVVPSHVLAREDGTPERFLLKILKALVGVGMLRSVKGPGGGYALARPPAKVTLLEVVEAVDGPVRGEAGGVEGKASSGLDQRLQAVC